MTAEETVRRMAERAMGRHRLKSARELAQAIGCGEQAARKLLNEETTRLNGSQWLMLWCLAQKEEKNNG